MAQPALKLASRERLPSRIEFEIAVPVLDGKGILSLVFTLQPKPVNSFAQRNGFRFERLGYDRNITTSIPT